MVAVGIALAACSTSSPGNAVGPPVSTGPSTATSGTKLQAPRVPNPLDVTKFEKNPCNVLSPAQARQVANLTKTDGNDGSVFPICGWTDSNYNSVAFSFVRGNGLSDAYQNQDSGSGYFQVAPDVAGYPAAFTSVSDGRSKGTCTMYVGVRNDDVMTVSSSFSASSPYRGDPCPVVQKAAEAAVATLKGGS
jgi:hypothetical protein